MDNTSFNPKRRKPRNPKRPRPRKSKREIKLKKGPLWARPYDGHALHPELDKVLAMPFLATIFISPVTRGMTYPVNNGTGQLARLDGLKKRMKYRLCHGIDDKAKGSYSKRGIPSSSEKGTHTDACLDMAIRTGTPPTNETSPYAYAVWRWWERNNHRPVLSQLPVCLLDSNSITAGDYFTLHTDPKTGRVTLWLWELKTGYKANPREYGFMAPPLEHVPLTAKNRFQLQVLLTRIAYEKELRMKIDGGCRVIHAWEVPGVNVCDVEVLEPSQLDPPYWTEKVDPDILYAALKKPEKPAKKPRKKKEEPKPPRRKRTATKKKKKAKTKDGEYK